MTSADWKASYDWARRFAEPLGGTNKEAEVLMLLLRYGAGLTVQDIIELTWREVQLTKAVLKRKTIERPLSLDMVSHLGSYRRYKHGTFIFHKNGLQRSRLTIEDLFQRPLIPGGIVPIDTLIGAVLGLDPNRMRKEQPLPAVEARALVKEVAEILQPFCTTKAAKDILSRIELQQQNSFPSVPVIEQELQKLQAMSQGQSSPRKLRKVLFDMLYDRNFWMHRKIAEQNQNPLSMYRYGPTQVKHYSVAAPGFYPYKN